MEVPVSIILSFLGVQLAGGVALAGAIVWIVNNFNQVKRECENSTKDYREEFGKKIESVYSAIDTARRDCEQKVMSALHDRENMRKDIEAKINNGQSEERLARNEVRSELIVLVGKTESVMMQAVTELKASIVRMSDKLEVLPKIESNLMSLDKQVEKLSPRHTGAD